MCLFNLVILVTFNDITKLQILINYSTSSCLTYSLNQLCVSIYRSVKGGPDNTCVGGGLRL